MSLSPAFYDLAIFPGATFRKRVTVLTGATGSAARDLTNYAATMTIKDERSGSVLDTLTAANGKLVLGGVNGTIDILYTAAQTAALTWTQGTYQLLITAPSGGDTDAILVGAIRVTTG